MQESEVEIKKMGSPFPFVPLTNFGARATSSDPLTEMTPIFHPVCSSYLCGVCKFDERLT